MEIKVEKKLDLKDKIVNIYNLNKKKIYITIIVFILITISTIFVKFNNERKNNLIAEKYIKAGIYLSSNQKENAKILLEEIILSKNKFYSILALNTIIEKNLILDHKKIIDYMVLAEGSIKSNNQKELLLFKKGLYLIKNSKNLEGEKLFKDLIKKNSQLKFLAEEIIIK
tara:strand:- start:89 stop:598 length:510 start_codon:yes stop_codon:yes gene_type:complete